MSEEFSVTIRDENNGVKHLGMVEGMAGLIQLLETVESSDKKPVKYEIYKRNV